MTGKFMKLCRSLVRSAHMMVGLPDYDAYRQHIRIAHPEREPMSHEEFFRNRQCARYGGAGRCC